MKSLLKEITSQTPFQMDWNEGTLPLFLLDDHIIPLRYAIQYAEFQIRLKEEYDAQ